MRLLILLLFTLTSLLSAQSSSEGDKKEKEEKKDDKIFTRKITDTTKLLEIRSGDIMDTKAMLRKTDFPNPEQMKILRSILVSNLGGAENYRIAARKSPQSVRHSLQAIWQIYRIDQDLKDINKDLSHKDLSDGRKKFLKEKRDQLNKDKSDYSKTVDKIDEFLEKLIKSEAIASTGDFFENEVSDEDGVDLIDKLGDAKVRLKKGAKVKTKVHPKDTSFYLVEFEGETLFAKRVQFKLK